MVASGAAGAASGMLSLPGRAAGAAGDARGLSMLDFRRSRNHLLSPWMLLTGRFDLTSSMTDFKVLSGNMCSRIAATSVAARCAPARQWTKTLELVFMRSCTLAHPKKPLERPEEAPRRWSSRKADRKQLGSRTARNAISEALSPRPQQTLAGAAPVDPADGTVRATPGHAATGESQASQPLERPLARPTIPGHQGCWSR